MAWKCYGCSSYCDPVNTIKSPINLHKNLAVRYSAVGRPRHNISAPFDVHCLHSLPFTTAIINQAQIIVLDCSNCRYISLLHCPSFNLQSYAASRRNYHLFIITHPRISLPIKPIKHIFRHGMLRYENTKRANVSEKPQLVALRDRGIDNFVDERPKQQRCILDVKYDISRIVLDYARPYLILGNFNDIDHESIIGKGETFHFFFEKSDDGRPELLSEVDGLQLYFVLERFDVKHFDERFLNCVVRLEFLAARPMN
mmetsp:Transcript_28630/g.60715  ORF Transcript_28630/g.60715 Transcript_28630/m.60715 type:complete len:256 (+) Transcript_28630:163-930(+)